MNVSSNIDWDSDDLLIDDSSSTDGLTSSPKALTILDFQEHLKSQDWNSMYVGRFAATVGKISRKIPYETKLEFDFHWAKLEFENQNKTTEIACWMTKKLPIDPLKIQPLTEELAEQWTIYKDYIFRIALIITGNSQTLKDLSIQNSTDKFSHNLTLTIGKIWKNLLELLQEKWDIIQPFLNNKFTYHFQKPEELFKQIIKDEHENDFNRFLSNRYCVNRKELQKYYDLSRKKSKGFGQLTSDEQKKLVSLKKQYTIENIWLDRTLSSVSLLIEEDTEDHILNGFVNTHNNWTKTLNELYTSAAKNPDVTSFHNTTWLNGRKYIGICHKDTKGNVRKARKTKVNKS